MGKYIKKKLKIFFKIFFIFLLKFDSLSKILTLMNSLDKFEKKKNFWKRNLFN